MKTLKERNEYKRLWAIEWRRKNPEKVKEKNKKRSAYKTLWRAKWRKNNIEQARKENREWQAARRIKWMKENGPCAKCGSNKRLEIDHIDPKTKIASHVWAWSKERAKEELKKCQVLCKNCHQIKTCEDNGYNIKNKRLLNHKRKLHATR